MASFSLDNAEIVRAVLLVLGESRDAANMSPETEADVRSIIRSGIRRFLFPDQGGFTYQWRWREKSHAISVVPTFSTGTIAVSGGTVTLTGGTFPDDMTDYFIRVAGHVLFVTVDTDATHVDVSNTQLEVAAGAEYEALRYSYPLPDDFGEWLGGVVYANGESFAGFGQASTLVSGGRLLSGSSEAEIRLRYAVGQGFNAYTTHYAVTSTPDAAAFRILFWPVPEPDAFIQGTYMSVPDDNLPADLTTPGSVIQVSPVYVEAVLEAILSVAEEQFNDAAGAHSARYQAALTSAIAHDRATGGPYDFSHRVNYGRGHGPILPLQFL